MTQPNTLIINLSDSQCGNCGKPADPYETHHFSGNYKMTSRPAPNPCGQEYKYLSSNYTGNSVKQACIEMRPDLEWIGIEYEDSKIT